MKVEAYSGKLHMIFFYLGIIAILMFSANIATHLNKFKDWITIDGNREGVPQAEWQLVLMELQTNAIGIKGSNMFTITYGFVGTVKSCRCTNILLF